VKGRKTENIRKKKPKTPFNNVESLTRSKSNGWGRKKRWAVTQARANKFLWSRGGTRNHSEGGGKKNATKKQKNGGLNFLVSVAV